MTCDTQTGNDYAMAYETLADQTLNKAILALMTEDRARLRDLDDLSIIEVMRAQLNAQIATTLILRDVLSELRKAT